MALTDRLCAAAVHELKRRRVLLEEPGVIRVALCFKVNPETGALRLVAFEDERDATRIGSPGVGLRTSDHPRS